MELKWFKVVSFLLLPTVIHYIPFRRCVFFDQAYLWLQMSTSLFRAYLHLTIGPEQQSDELRANLPRSLNDAEFNGQKFNAQQCLSRHSTPKLFDRQLIKCHYVFTCMRKCGCVCAIGCLQIIWISFRFGSKSIIWYFRQMRNEPFWILNTVFFAF